MGQSTTAGEVRSVTSAIEKKYNLPEDTLYKIAGIESSYKADAVSPKGAQGWFQFMPATAKEYGVTNPRDLAQSAEGAGRFMRDLIDRHNGDMPSALAYYNGGKKAVKALQAGQPWPETVDYLKKFGEPATAQKAPPQAPLGEQFVSQSVSPSTDGPSASRLVNDARKRDDQFGGVTGFASNLPRAVSLGFQSQNTVWNYFQDKGMEIAGSTEMNWDAPEVREALTGVDTKYHGYLGQAATREEFNARLGRLQESQKVERELGEMGTPLALTGGIAGGLPDIPTLIGFIPGLGGAGLLTKTSRLANMARMGALGAASNVAIDAVANQYKPAATTDDLYYSAAFGLGLGALAGGAVNPRLLALARENEALQQHGLKAAAGVMRKDIAEIFNQPNARDIPEGWAKGVDAGIDGRPIPADWVKKVDDHLGTWGNPPETARGLIVKGTPSDPAAPRVKAPVEPVDAPAGGVKPPKWAPEWDTPQRMDRMGAKDILLIPPVQKVSHGAEYIRLHSIQRDLVAVMDRALKSIDLRTLKFDVVDPKADFNKLKVSPTTAQYMHKAFGVVSTPGGSTGDGIEMALRGYGYGRSNTGLNEETFVHELVHVATVYKADKIARGDTAGMHPETVQAYREMGKLYRQVEKAAMGRQDLPERFAANMKNDREFIAYGLTNRPFQEFLRSVEIDGPKSTLWTRFTNTLRKMLGMTKDEGNALGRLIDLSQGLLDKSGIEGKPRANLEATHPSVNFDDVKAANDAGLSPVFGIGLGLEHKLQGSKSTQPVRQLAAKLFGTTVGRKDHAVVTANVWDDTIKRAEGWVASHRKVGYTAFEAWRKEKGHPFWRKAEDFEEFGGEVDKYVRGFPGEYHPEVRKAGDNIRKMMADAADEVNNPAIREGGVKRGLTEVEVLDDTGKSVLVGKLEKNPNYLPRKHDSRKWNDITARFGHEAVQSWWANAYAKVHPERSAEDAQKWARWYTRTVEEAHMNRSADHLEEMMSGYDEKALRESLMVNGGFNEKEAIEIIKGMFQKPGTDTGRTASSLRHRNHVSETHTEKWKTSTGGEVEVSLHDFIQSNALDTVESYYRRVASSVALANHLDVYRQSEIGSMIDKATAREFGSSVSEAATAAAKRDLKFAFDRIQGLPQEEWTGFGKAMEMWRDFNVIRLMGGAVWNQATELSQIIGTMGWKTTLGAVRELKGLRRDIATGKAPNDFLDHLENTIGGVGSEYVARLDFSVKDDWVRHKGDTAFNRRLDALDAGTKKFAKGVLDYTGMTGLMVQQKRIHAIALTNHLVDVANGKPSGFLTKDRLAWMGLSEADHAKMNAAIKAFSKKGKGEFGKKWDFDFKEFSKAHPEENAKLMNAIHRESRRVVQENDLASMVPLMGTTLGKTVFQFMNFTVHGWNKSMLFAMNHRDWSTLSTVLHGSFFASLAYMGRTQLSAMGMDEGEKQDFLAKRLATKQVVANSFGKMAQASLLPQVYDSTVGQFTGAMFAGMRTTSDLSSFASLPTLQAINSTLSLGKIVRNGLSDETQTTQKDIKSWARLVPLNNVAPISTLFNALAKDYPTSEKEQE